MPEATIEYPVWYKLYCASLERDREFFDWLRKRLDEEEAKNAGKDA